jgi:hypothetical protein
MHWRLLGNSYTVCSPPALLKGAIMAHRFLAGLSLGLTACVAFSSVQAADPETLQQVVERGVRYLQDSQANDGTWPTHAIGATALVGLTLLECDFPPTDPAIEKAAEYLRHHWEEINDHNTTYAVALMILFFDRLDDPADTPLIQGLALRLLAGQTASGGWSYSLPLLSGEDVRQLKTLVQHQVELKARGALPKTPQKKPGDTSLLAPEIHQMLLRVQQQGPATPRGLESLAGGVGDNSNTQFAILGLWVARRYGIPVDAALARTATRFRRSQHTDGGWGYMPTLGRLPRFGAPTPSMTCAGLLGLALGYGSAREVVLRSVTHLKSAKAAPPPADPAKDPMIRAGFAFLAQALAQSPNDFDQHERRGGMGDAYYLLWSVERVAVAYDLRTIGGIDWYTWGATYLRAAQRNDGSWMGRFGSDIDTSFALLFLRRANLCRDLTAYLKGAGSVEVALRSGVVPAQRPGDATKVQHAKTPQAVADPNAKLVKNAAPVQKQQAVHPPAISAPPADETATEIARLGNELVSAAGAQQEELLEQLKQGKGASYTEALARGIPQLHGTVKTKARAALAERLARMTAGTLHNKLSDQSPEVRRAAALACAMKGDKAFIPALAGLLEDRQNSVVRAAHTALKELTGVDLGPAQDAAPQEVGKAAMAWKEWWLKQQGK